MIPEGYEAIRENLTACDVLDIVGADKEVEKAVAARQVLLAKFGVSGDSLLFRDEANAVHLIQPKEQVCEPSSTADSSAS